ncbi:MAG: DinB family protein [Bacteroidota bacterium]
MSNIETTISKIKQELIGAFASVDAWFDKHESLLQFKPATGRWTPALVLEHIMLTNHYLLILIDKGSDKALKLAETTDLPEATRNYQFEENMLEDIGIHKSFQWERPEHMEPSGETDSCDVRLELRYQLYRCLCHLKALSNGAGVLYKTTMTVNNLGKLDVYQYLYFLAQHVKRHRHQLENIENEYLLNNELPA